MRQLKLTTENTDPKLSKLWIVLDESWSIKKNPRYMILLRGRASVLKIIHKWN